MIDCGIITETRDLKRPFALKTALHVRKKKASVFNSPSPRCNWPDRSRRSSEGIHPNGAIWTLVKHELQSFANVDSVAPQHLFTPGAHAASMRATRHAKHNN